jgi:hypothetical protein
MFIMTNNMKKNLSLIISIIAVAISIYSVELIRQNKLGSRTDGGFWQLQSGNVYFGGKVLVATSTSAGTLNLYSTGTTTIDIGTSSTTSIACIRTKNNSDSGYGYTSFQNGTPSSTIASKCGY